MTRPETALDRVEDPDPLQDVVRYVPGLLTIVLTVGVSVVDHLPGSRPSMVMSIIFAGIPATGIALLISRSDWNPSGSCCLALAVLAWGIFSLVRMPLLDPGSTRVDGSVYVLADLALVWLGSYLTSAAVVYGIDWPTPHIAPDGEMDTPDPEPADD